MKVLPLRFADVRLGQTVELDGACATDVPVGERVCEMVRRWSGASAASLVSLRAPDEGFAPDHVAGWVLARHLDGSNRADVEVLMHASGVRASAVVRVALD